MRCLPSTARSLVLLALAAVLPLLMPAQAAAAWVRPVPGQVTRAFTLRGSPFAAGQHRGLDFAARPGAVVEAACGGRVAVARRVGRNGGVVTIACGPWRVTHLPLARIDVREGVTVPAGARIGTAASPRRHPGLHLGVRRSSRRFGYVDPLQFLSRRAAPPGVGPSLRPRRRARVAPAGPKAALPTAAAPPAPLSGPGARVAPGLPAAAARVAPKVPAASAPLHVAPPFAPPLAWAGLAVLLAGTVGVGRLRSGSNPGRVRAARARVRPTVARGRLRS